MPLSILPDCFIMFLYGSSNTLLEYDYIDHYVYWFLF